MNTLGTLDDALFAVPSKLESALAAEGGVKCSAADLYGAVFRLGDGCIQRCGEAGGLFKANPIIVGKSDTRMHRKILFEDTFEQTLEEFSDYEWAIVSGCTYWGRVNSAERQSKLYALIFDLDSVESENVVNFFSGARFGLYPYPNYVVESGHGLHLYYVLEEPVDLYPNIKTQLKELKYHLTKILWNRYTSCEDKIQFQGINQGFRIPQGRTKIAGVRAQAWRFSSTPTTIEALNEWAIDEVKVDLGTRWKDSTMSLIEAKEKYPEWYERVIERGEHGQWVVKPALYEWWLNLIAGQMIPVGHRYFCVMSLAIFAAKCGIYDVDKVRSDAMKLIPHFTASNPSEPFTETDIDSALECLDLRYIHFPRKDIEKITGIPMPPNKRNGRKQEIHLATARAVQEIVNNAAGTDWRYHGGAPTKKELVKRWREKNPQGKKIDCERELGLSRHTVLKWWYWSLSEEV